MGRLWQRMHDINGTSTLQGIDLETLTVSSPTVIFLCGFQTTNKQPGFIAGAIKTMEGVFATHPELKQPDKIYAWSHTSLANIFNLASYNLKPDTFSSQAGKDIARHILLPLVAASIATDKDGKTWGTPLPEEQARKNLRNITLFSYSAGSIVGQETFNATMKMMQDIGYSRDKARSMLHEVVMVNTGSISRPTQEQDRFTTLYLIASNDRIVRWKNRLWRPLKMFFARFGRDLKIKTLSKTSLIINAAVKKTPGHWAVPDSYHDLPHYLTTDENHNQFARIALYSLFNAVGRTATPDPVGLLQPPAQLEPTPFITAYRERIAQALQQKDLP